jgi:hypothetical protein
VFGDKSGELELGHGHTLYIQIFRIKESEIFCYFSRFLKSEYFGLYIPKCINKIHIVSLKKNSDCIDQRLFHPSYVKDVFKLCWASILLSFLCHISDFRIKTEFGF